MFFFWVCVSLILYTYLIYPGILFVWAKIKGLLQSEKMKTSRGFLADGSDLPSVTIVVSAYNEEAVLEKKIWNLSTLDYPTEKLEVLFGSDGSTDNTSAMLTRSLRSHFRFVDFQQRRGKAAVLNELIPQASGDIIVLSDANTIYSPDTIRMLVRHFSDPTVGAVCGELILEVNNKTSGGLGEGSYWKYENRLKLMEDHIRSTVGATGGVYAIRKRLFTRLPIGKAVTDDFVVSLGVLKQGFKVAYDPQAIAREQSSNSVAGEFRRKVRIGAANFHGLSELFPLLHPRYGFVAFVLWSRKITRWLVPLFLLGLFLCSLLLASESTLYFTVLIFEVIFLLSAIIGMICERMNFNIGLFGLPYYFVAMNAALFVGFIRFILRLQRPTWDVVR
jgi:cellulose synthase/poly-beta-1,6-N-acetylglucosamine synthase-like glycosyltransferase